MAVPRLSPPAYRRVTLFALVALAFIVVTGAAVRLTGSGLGCTDWPTCEDGRLAPVDATDFHAMVEFVNRTITGLVSVAVILAVLGSLARVPRRRDLTAWSLGLVAGVVGQIVLGGLTVLFDLAPPLVMAHFLLSLVLLTDALVLHHRAGEPDEGRRSVPQVGPRTALLGRLLLAAAGLVVVTGTIVTATGPHAGDEKARRFGFALPDVARLHGGAVFLFLALTLTVLWLLARERAPAPVQQAARALLLVSVAQGALGYAQYFSGVPALLVGFHILGAVLVWSAAVRLDLALRAAPAPVPSSSAPAGAVLVAP